MRRYLTVGTLLRPKPQGRHAAGANDHGVVEEESAISTSNTPNCERDRYGVARMISR